MGARERRRLGAAGRGTGHRLTHVTRALLFDLDGTLLKSDPLHLKAFGEMFAERGMTLTEEDYVKRIHGRHNSEMFPELFPGEDPVALADEKEARFRDMLSGGFPPMPGAPALLDRAAREGWRLAVVTNAPRLNAEHMLRAIGLDGRFEVLIIGDECARAKPDPMPYQQAMKAVGVTPNHAVAFEDSGSGLRAARASGAYTVGVRSAEDDFALRNKGAQFTIEDFEDPALVSILERLTGEAQT